MSRLNISGVIKSIKSNSSVYTPIVEAIVNSIDSIFESKRTDGKITVLIKRENALDLEGSIHPVQSVEVIDNGVGFTQKNRDSFDTYFSDLKMASGGKGFGRFMYLKYFSTVLVESIYKNEDGYFHKREFTLGKDFDIIVDEKDDKLASASDTCTKVKLNDIIDNKYFDKGLEVISRKLLEKILIFFVDETLPCPIITIIDSDNNSIVLNDYFNQTDSLIKSLPKIQYTITSLVTAQDYSFTATIFKVFCSQSQNSTICLTGHNREVSESPLHAYIPEFEDEFFEEEQKDSVTSKKNYIIKVYVSGEYLNDNVSLEREAFNFGKDTCSELFPLSQKDIEKGAANVARNNFLDEVKIREDKKRSLINVYITDKAPWHNSLLPELNLSEIPFHASDEQIELAFQKIKFSKEQEARIELNSILGEDDNTSFDLDLRKLASKVTEAGKNDLVHYVCNRRVVLKLLNQLLKRKDNGDAQLEKELHNLIFPMGGDSTTIDYEKHNLWLLDERLVFSEFVASDKKISKKSARTEPDLVIFDKKRSFRNGDNEYSNPLTVFEFKRPKRDNYSKDEDPIEQVGNYVNEIREGKYETPEGVERVKVNEYTPVYGFIVCDMCDKIRYIAETKNQLTKSPDGEGYFGYHNGYKVYFEIFSYKHLQNNADLRNRIFFKKLSIEL